MKLCVSVVLPGQVHGAVPLVCVVMAVVPAGTSVCCLLQGLLGTDPKFPAGGHAAEDRDSCPYTQWHLLSGKPGTVLCIHTGSISIEQHTMPKLQNI